MLRFQESSFRLLERILTPLVVRVGQKSSVTFVL